MQDHKHKENEGKKSAPTRGVVQRHERGLQGAAGQQDAAAPRAEGGEGQRRQEEEAPALLCDWWGRKGRSSCRLGGWVCVGVQTQTTLAAWVLGCVGVNKYQRLWAW